MPCLVTFRTHLLKAVCDHVSHSPALVLKQTPQRSQQDTVTRLLLLGHCLRDRNEDVDGEKSDTVLVVGGEVLEKRDHLLDDD